MHYVNCATLNQVITVNYVLNCNYYLVQLQGIAANFNLVCYLHCKNEIVKISNLFFTVARNSGNVNLIGCVGCYDGMVINMLLYAINLVYYVCTKKQN